MTARRLLTSMALLAALMSACGGNPAPVVATPPHYPEFIMPTLTPADPRFANVEKSHAAAWQFLQAGDLLRAEKDFQAILKKTAGFYPSDAALGYVALARKDYAPALQHFDHVLQTSPEYIPALVGRGDALLAMSRETEALPSFEAAVRRDPSLTEIARRVEVLKARAAQEKVAAAARAAAEGRLDEASRDYEDAIVASPESAFLFRDLADVEAKQNKTDAALEHYRKALQLDSSDVESRMHIGEILQARDDVSGAIAMYTEAASLDSSPEIRKRIMALEARAAYLKLPAEYRALPEQHSITRGDLAALVGIRLEPLVARAPVQPVVVTDTRNHWAAQWILPVVQAGLMDVYDNHTFQPGSEMHRSDLAQAVSRLLKLIAFNNPALLKEWQGRQAKMSDVGVSNLNFADVSLSVSAGVLPLTDEGQFQMSRPVSGEEAIDAISRLERLNASTR